MPNSATTSSDSIQCSTVLETKLKETIELLHLWQNESCSYRHLIEAVAAGRYSLGEVRQLLREREKERRLTDYVFVPLSKDEYGVLGSTAKLAELKPHEFLWACLDTVMNSRDDEEVLQGCREAAERRFEGYILPEWARNSEDCTEE